VPGNIAILAPTRSFWAPHPPDGGGTALRACGARASAGPPAAQNLLAVPVTTRVDDAADAMTAVLGPKDLERFRDGSHCDLHRVLGSHRSDAAHVRFAVWAPNAERVSVVGDFNGWRVGESVLARGAHDSEIWEGRIADVDDGARYKYHIESRHGGYRADKGDPFAFCWEEPPGTASRFWPLQYEWGDGEWLSKRSTANSLDAPWSIYELHVGSWRRHDGAVLGYRELAGPLVEHLTDLGFTHVELLPLMEHPFYGSWGYQTIGYFAPTARYGTPQDLKYLIDQLHQHGIGVILDWVPSHFPDDLHGLNYFDGTHLFEHADRRRGYQPEWQSYVFNYDRGEVRSFLASSAMFWLDEYHADALRVDAVASMLYLDYARKEGQWLPNEQGGRENWGAVRFLRELNTRVYERHPHVQTIAEESTAWPGVSRPVDAGGLGFGMKWNMGWMHDTLRYFAKDPLYRKHHHNDVTFSLWYAFAENFVLPLSHDEVVHGKGSLLGKMPGDEWQRFANLRALLGYQFVHPGKKLLFMGAELAARTEWNHDVELDWGLEHRAPHAGVRRWLKDLNALYRAEPALWQDFSPRGFEWIDANDTDNSVLTFVRRDASGTRLALAALNFTPVPRHNYQVGVPRGGFWEEVLNSDSSHYGGSGQGNLGGAHAAPTGTHGRYHTLSLTLPPLGMALLRSVSEIRA
jgi:1,4-alpha-glucan branching enzyme